MFTNHSSVLRRRIYAGWHFVESAMFIRYTSVPSAFEIGPPVEDGALVEFKREVMDSNIVA